ncbi:hypothetical protein MMC31_006271 [Peltigera leucophlebia]|nr:hypothetical protein [Peltigera leucophlebia]
MANYGSPQASPIVASENPCLPPPLAYVPMVIPYPGTPGAPFFDGQNITRFLDLYDQLCSDYRLSELEKINRLPWYCEFFTGNYIKILIKGADWVAVRSILRREYKDNDLDQLMNSREFLEALKKKSRSEDDDLFHYCQLLASISRDLMLRKRLDLYTQCQWFLQGLPEKVVMDIFYRYNIDLEDDDDLDFEDLLEKALVLVKRRKYLADFIRDKETDLVNKYTEPQEKVPTTPNIVEPFEYPAHDLTLPTRFQTLQGAIQEDIPVVRIHESRVGKVKAGEVSSSDNDSFLVSDPTDDFYENLGALFADCKPVDEDLEQLRVSSVSIVEPVEDAAAAKTDPNRPNTKTRKAVREFCILRETEVESMKKTVLGREQERFPGVDGTAVRRPMQRAMECEDHG